MDGRIALLLLFNTMVAGAASMAGFEAPVIPRAPRVVPPVSIAVPDSSWPILAIENDSGEVLHVTWTGDGVDADPTLAPGDMLLAAPEAVSRIVFRGSGPAWRYAFDGRAVDWSALRHFGFRRDELDPYLYSLRISRTHRLEVAHGGPRGDPVIPGLPATARAIRSH